MRGATKLLCLYLFDGIISIHAPHAGCDFLWLGIISGRQRFQSTHPMRGATGTVRAALFPSCISIHAPHAGCDVPRLDLRHLVGISIHAPHAGCDEDLEHILKIVKDFNPRTPCGVRPHLSPLFDRERTFQSTHPMRGATRGIACGIYLPTRFQSTHPMRGATIDEVCSKRILSISIHAPHAGCDPYFSAYATVIFISIHAPHAGCDRLTMWTRWDSSRFQSTHPMRGATLAFVSREAQLRFQSTHPMRGATHFRFVSFATGEISIHAPHAGCDHGRLPRCIRTSNFNPRTPCGVRQ